MSSPNQVSKYPPRSTEPYIRSFVDDKAITAHIIELAKDEDDPPIVVRWDDRGLESFWNKAVAYGAVGAVPPPNQINGGAQLAGPANGTAIRNLKCWILEYVRSQVQPPPNIVGETACLACSQYKFGHVPVRLGLMIIDPWFAGVLGHGPPLASPMGSIWHPRPRVSSGLCDQIHLQTELWQ